MIDPLEKRAPGEASQRTAAATSSGRATRPKGDCPLIASPPRPASEGRAISVWTNPGATVPTEIPCGANATAIDWPKAFIPALEAPYAGESGSPRNAPRLDTFTTAPPPEVMRYGTAQYVALAAPSRLTASVRDPVAAGGEGLRHGPTDATGGAGDQDRPVHEHSSAIPATSRSTSVPSV